MHDFANRFSGPQGKGLFFSLKSRSLSFFVIDFEEGGSVFQSGGVQPQKQCAISQFTGNLGETSSIQMKRIDSRRPLPGGLEFDRAADRLHQNRQLTGIHATEHGGIFKRHVRVERIGRDRQQDPVRLMQRLTGIQ